MRNPRFSTDRAVPGLAAVATDDDTHFHRATAGVRTNQSAVLRAGVRLVTDKPQGEAKYDALHVDAHQAVNLVEVAWIRTVLGIRIEVVV